MSRLTRGQKVTVKENGLTYVVQGHDQSANRYWLRLPKTVVRFLQLAAEGGLSDEELLEQNGGDRAGTLILKVLNAIPPVEATELEWNSTMFRRLEKLENDIAQKTPDRAVEFVDALSVLFEGSPSSGPDMHDAAFWEHRWWMLTEAVGVEEANKRALALIAQFS